MAPDLAYRDRLWSAADKLRGCMDAAAYKNVMLALLFLRFAGLGRNTLRLPAAARWSKLAPGRLDAAFEAIEEANPALRGTLPRGLDEVPRVGELIQLCGGIEPAGGHDSLGRTYEYFLGRFARAEGRRGGQFYTPQCLVRLLAALLGPLRGSVYDPCCGTGGMFVQAGGTEVREIFGQEANPGTWRLARLNLLLHGLDADLGEAPADSFTLDQHAGRQADIVLANPPFNQRDWLAGEARADDPRWRYGVPPGSNANFAWIQQILSHLAPGGRAGVLLSNGATSARKAGEGGIRRRIVEAGWASCVVALPAQLFLSTPIPACAWVLERHRPRETLFVDARGLGEQVARARRVLRKEEIARIADCYHAFRAGGDPEEAGFCSVANDKRIADRDHALSPGLYVGARPAAREVAGPERVRELAREWERLAKESEQLSATIRELDLGLS